MLISEEFTKEIPPKQEEKPLADTCRTGKSDIKNKFICMGNYKIFRFRLKV